MIHRIKRLIMTLAALLAVTTGAWAQGPTVWTRLVDISYLRQNDILAEGSSLTSDVIKDFIYIRVESYKKNDVLQTLSSDIKLSAISSFGENCVISAGSDTYAPVDEFGDDGNAWVVTKVNEPGGQIEIYLSGIYYDPNGVALTTNNDRTEWTIDKMPAADVELTVRYYDEAEVSGPVTAATGVRVGEDKPLVSGLSTEHGTLVYAITAATVTTAPADDQFAAANNTAKNLTTEGTYRVWYYVDPDATHSPSDPAYADVEVLTNKFDITFTALNTLTIQGSQATVTVDGTPATPDADGKITGVKAGSEVTVTAAQGYKLKSMKVTSREFLWENDRSNGEPYWGNSKYRFGLNGHDANKDCLKTFDNDSWTSIKEGVVYFLFEDSEASIIRITTGWWTGAYGGTGHNCIDMAVDDPKTGKKVIKLNIKEDGDLYYLIDEQGLLFTGEGYLPIGIYRLQEINLNGGTNGGGNSYQTKASFTMPLNDVTVDYELERAGYELTVGAKSWATYYSDEPLTLGTDQADGALYTLSSVDQESVVLSQPIAVAPEKTPLLVYNSATEAKDFLLMPTDAQADNVTAAPEFRGTLAATDVTTLTSPAVYVLYNNMFVRATTGTIPANRAYIALGTGSGVRQLIIGNATNIDTTNFTNETGTWYMLDGRRIVQKPTRPGVYIQDGRKRVVK